MVKREFYAAMGHAESWNIRNLREKIGSVYLPSIQEFGEFAIIREKS
jgi:predicted nuclease of restriction endonuclease-like (RecB) superfamily